MCFLIHDQVKGIEEFLNRWWQVDFLKKLLKRWEIERISHLTVYILDKYDWTLFSVGSKALINMYFFGSIYCLIMTTSVLNITDSQYIWFMTEMHSPKLVYVLYRSYFRFYPWFIAFGFEITKNHFVFSMVFIKYWHKCLIYNEIGPI